MFKRPRTLIMVAARDEAELRWDRGRGRSEVLDNAPSGAWVEIKLTRNARRFLVPCGAARVSTQSAVCRLLVQLDELRLGNHSHEPSDALCQLRSDLACCRQRQRAP